MILDAVFVSRESKRLWGELGWTEVCDEVAEAVYMKDGAGWDGEQDGVCDQATEAGRLNSIGKVGGYG